MIVVGFLVASAVIGLGIQVIQIYREAKQEKQEALESRYQAELGVAKIRIRRLEADYGDLSTRFDKIFKDNEVLRKIKSATGTDKANLMTERIQNLEAALRAVESESAKLKQEKEQLELKTQQLLLGPPGADKLKRDFYTLQKKAIELKDALNDAEPKAYANIEYLHPTMRQLAEEFVQQANAQGVAVKVYDTLRSIRYQDRLHTEGKTQLQGGQSPHNFGFAFEAVPLIDRKPAWDYGKNRKQWDLLGKIAHEVGLSWGGSGLAPQFTFPEWKNLGKYYDITLRIKTRNSIAAGSTAADLLAIVFANQSDEKLEFQDFGKAIAQEFKFLGSMAVKGVEFALNAKLRDRSFLDSEYIRIINYGSNGWVPEWISVELDGVEVLRADNIIPNKGTDRHRSKIQDYNQSYWEQKTANIRVQRSDP